MKNNFLRTVILVFTLFLVIGCSSQPSKLKITESVSDNLNKLKTGMTSEEVTATAKLPDNIEILSDKLDTQKLISADENEWYYPSDLPSKVSYGCQIWYYNVDVSGRYCPAFCLYFDKKLNLIGWSCDEIYSPDKLEFYKSEEKRKKNRSLYKRLFNPDSGSELSGIKR